MNSSAESIIHSHLQCHSVITFEVSIPRLVETRPAIPQNLETSKNFTQSRNRSLNILNKTLSFNVIFPSYEEKNRLIAKQLPKTSPSLINNHNQTSTSLSNQPPTFSPYVFKKVSRFEYTFFSLLLCTFYSIKFLAGNWRV
jgi:hypothetical protein